MPFGNGTHACPGNELAKLEMLVILHHLTTKYRLVNLVIHILPNHSFLFWVQSFERVHIYNVTNNHMIMIMMQVVYGRCSKWDPIWSFCSSSEWLAHHIASQEALDIIQDIKHIPFLFNLSLIYTNNNNKFPNMENKERNASRIKMYEMGFFQSEEEITS